MAFERNKKKRNIDCILLMLTGIVMMMSLSCKKTIEQAKKNAIVNAVTNGRWYVEQYKQDTTDVTADFFGYEFQFYENGTVDGIKGTSTSSGTWVTDISNYTITAAFLPAAGDTLNRLSYTWKITDSALDYVSATATTSTGSNTLHLRKK